MSFNRYMVECEYLMLFALMILIKVLIDTWWNVNHSMCRRFRSEMLVLIDTWWNVNEFIILEKKKENYVLIDTWWNVN